MYVIGFGYKAQVGKDTSASYLEKVFPGRVKRAAFADKLKRITMELFGLTHEQCYGPKEIKEAVDPRYGLTPREIMQGVGEKMREVCPSIWVDTVFNTTIPQLLEKGYDCFAVADVRYPNEADRIHEKGGFVVRIDRNAGGASVGAEHSSETAMDDYEEWDFIIDNNGSFEDLYERLDDMVREIGYDRKERGH